MTPKEIIDEARNYIPDTGGYFPVTDATLYGRINARQRQLFALASSWNQEYYGRSVTGTLSVVDGVRCIDLNDLEGTDLWPIEAIDHLEVATLVEQPPADNTLSVNDQVSICRADERFSHLKPRVMLRSHALEAVGDDLDNVSELRLWYSRRPRKIDTKGEVTYDLYTAEEAMGDPGIEEGDPKQRPQDVEIGDPWEWLLVWDLVKTLAKYSAQTDSEKDDPVVMMAKDSEKELLAIFESHVRQYGRTTEHITE